MRSPSQMWSRVSTGSPGFRFAFTGTVLSILNIAASFVSKGDHWIHFRCAARRDVASQERDGAQHERNDDKCDRVYGTNTEEQVLDQPGQSQRRQQSHSHTGQGQPHSFSDNQLQDVMTIGPKSNANADFVRALRGGKADQSIQTDARQYQRQNGKGT